MVPVTQTKFPVRGNCVRACIASILEIGIDEMPDWEEHTTNWFVPAKKWLHERGYHLSCTVYAPSGYAIGVGTSPRNVNMQHAVVVLDGMLAHDPHPSAEFIATIDRYWSIEPQQTKIALECISYLDACTVKGYFLDKFGCDIATATIVRDRQLRKHLVEIVSRPAKDSLANDFEIARKFLAREGKCEDDPNIFVDPLLYSEPITLAELAEDEEIFRRN